MSLLPLLKQHGVRFGLSIAVILLMLLHATDALPLKFIQRLENFSYDARLNLTMPNTKDNRIVIVDIDEKSLQEQGRWPWGRDKLGLLVDKLFDTYHIDTLGFDVVFAEKDESSGLKNLENIGKNFFKDDANFANALNNIKPTLDYDQLFANSLKGRKVVMGYYFSSNADAKKTGLLPAPVLDASVFNKKDIGFFEAKGFGANLALLQTNAAAAGHFNPKEDIDGIVRKISVLVKYNGQYYDSLALAVARTYLKNPPLLPEFASLGAGKSYAGLENLWLAKQRIPVDDEVTSYVPFRGMQGSFEYVSASDILNNKIPANSLKDKIVLVGTTAPGLLDLRSAPMQKAYAGVEVHANLIAGILDNNIKQRPAYTNAIELLMLLAAGLLLAFTLPILNPLKATLMTLAVLIGVLLINFFAWQSANLVLPIASLLFMIGLIYLLNMSYGFFVESRSKRQLAGLFGQYVPPELVDEMAKNPEAVNMEPDNREMSVLFTDIRGFTTISESLSPQQLSEMMNEILSPMTQIIHQHRGTVDKYMGDAIMAFWGAPLQDNNHAQHALDAAMNMAAALKKVNEKFTAKGWQAIQMGIGVNSGQMAVGNMGSSFRMAYTVMGDNVNLGSRLEALTKNYGVTIIVSEYVKAQTANMVYRELDAVRVKGKEAPVTIYEPLGLETEVSTEALNALKLHKEALKLYRNQQWDLAEMQWINLQNSQPQTLYALYIERIQLFRKIPPAKNWDGVYNFESK